MSGARRMLAFSLVALLALLAAGPFAAARCATRGFCPMMAKAPRSNVPCHGAGGSMTAPMSCCEPKASSAPRSDLSRLEPVSSLSLPGSNLTRAIEVATSVLDFSRDASLHSLGRFTLLSIWRI